MSSICVLVTQDKKIAHCDLGKWKGDAVESWDPMQAGRERILILKALLAEKKVFRTCLRAICMGV